MSEIRRLCLPIAFVVGINLSFAQTPQTILSNPIPFKVVGEAPFAVAARATSGLPVTYSSSDTSVAKVNGNIVTVLSAGTTNIVFSQAGDENYLPDSAYQQLIVYGSASVNIRIAGTTVSGGTLGGGTLFTSNTDGSGFEKIHEFSTENNDGFNPQGKLLFLEDGFLYGTTYASNPANGVVYKIRPDGTGFTVLHRFEGTDGAQIRAGLIIASDGLLYGTSDGGGDNNAGTIFRLNRTGGQFSVVHHFKDTVEDNGSGAYGGLLEGADGKLYGMTRSGGSNAEGILYSYSPTDSTFTNLFDFWSFVGTGPRSTLTQTENGDLLGVTYEGGSNNGGVIFTFQPDSLEHSVLTSLDGDDGANPFAVELARSRSGQYFGTTVLGNSEFFGTVFGLDTAYEFFTVTEFDYEMGANPNVGVSIGPDGKLYGMTYSGGSYDGGTAFSVDEDGSNFQKLFDLDVTTGLNPLAPLSLVYTVVQSQTITFDSLAAFTHNDPPFKLTATASSGLAVSYASSDSTVATIHGDTLVIVGAGTAIITASQSGNYAFDPAEDVERTLTVLKASQTILSNTIPFKVVGEAPFAVVASTTAGLPVTYSSSNSAVATVSGIIVTVHAAGTTNIVFNQSGDDNYLAAPSTYQQLTVHDLSSVGVRIAAVAASDGALGGGTVFIAGSDGTGFDIIHEFSSGDDNGSGPGGKLLYLDDGYLYGTTNASNPSAGVVYRVKPDGTEFEVLHRFQDSDGSEIRAGVMLASDGLLYGTTASGGIHGAGTIYRLDKTGGQFAVVHHFDNENGGGAHGGLLEGADGMLYGVTVGGGATGNGVLYKFSMWNTQFTKLYEFQSSTGSGPHSTLVQDENGDLLGLTYQGGSNGGGVVFRFTPDGSQYEAISDLGGSSGSGPYWVELMKSTSGKYFGTTLNDATGSNGTVFSVNPDGSGFQTITEFDLSTGASPHGGVTIGPDGKLYGLTSLGGSNDGGTGFSVNEDGTGFQKLFDLGDSTGTYAVAAPALIYTIRQSQTITFDALSTVAANAAPFKLTATASSGLNVTYISSDTTVARIVADTLVIVGAGTAQITASQSGNYEFSPATSVTRPIEVTIASQTILSNPIPFKVVGEAPFAVVASTTSGLPVTYSSSNSAVATVQGNIVTIHGAGTTTIGFSMDGNTVYESATAGQQLTVYASSDVRVRVAATSLADGTLGGGTVFISESDGTGLAKIHEFAQDDDEGYNPYGKLIYLDDGYFYGTAYAGNPSTGVVYKVKLDGTGFEALHQFQNSEGNKIYSGVILASDGLLYGTTVTGGVHNAGTIFRLDRTGGQFEVVHHFDPLEGTGSYGGLLEGADGMLYGMTIGGGAYGEGVLYKYSPQTNEFTNLYSFDSSTGANSFSTLIQDENGDLLGVTFEGGSNDGGVIFRIRPDGSEYEVLHDIGGVNGYGPFLVELAKSRSGKYFGTTLFGGGASYGTVFAIDADGSGYQTITDFDVAMGVNPNGGVSIGPDGMLYGLTSFGGANEGGTGFRVNEDGTGFQKLFDLDFTTGTFPASAPIFVYSLLQSQTITFDSLETVTAGDPPVPLTATASSGLTVIYSSSDTTVAKIQGSNLVAVSGGTASITASQPGNTTYKAAAPVSRMVTVLNPVLRPTVPASGILFTNTFSTQLHVAFTAGNGTRFLVVARPGSAVNWQPQDGQEYSASSTFSQSPDLGNGNRILSADATLSFDVTGLTPATNYFFTVYEYNGEGSLTKYLSTGAPVASKTTLALPNVFVTSPTNAATGFNVTLSVTAKSVTGATTYTLQVSPQADFSSGIIERSGARTQSFSGLAFNATYYTRVKTDLSPDFGASTTFTTGTAESFAFVTTPADMATNVVLTSLALNVTSNTVIGATVYTIELNTDNTFTGTSHVSSGTKTRTFTGLALGTTYFSRVKTELSPNWGATKQFTTTAPSGASYVVTPANNAVNVLYQPTVTANDVGAGLYKIQLSPQPDFSSGIVEMESSSRTMTFTGLMFNTKYYSRVSTDLDSNWGAVKNFTVNSPLPFSYITNPTNGAVNVNNIIDITSNIVTGATQYTIEANTASDFTGTSTVMSGPGRTYTFTLAHATVYYVRVQTDVAPGEWGPTRSFTTRDPLAFSYITSPVNGATNVTYVTNITSNAVPTATNYTIEANTASDFTGTSIVMSGTAKTYSFSLAVNTTYYVRVSTNLTPGQWGATRSFTTGNSLAKSYITSPVDGATNVAYITNITANTVQLATQYTIEANTAPDFTGTSVVMSGSGKTYSFSLGYSQTYYVRVQTDVTPGQWGPTRSFTTSTPLTASYITSPANGATNVNWVTNITANTVTGATGYTIEANTASDFTGTSVVKSGAVKTYSFTLAYNTLYYVRVGTNLIPGQWGATRTFTTGSPQSFSFVTSPVNGSTGVPLTVNVTANTITGATSYTIELNTSSDFTGTSIVKGGSGRTKSFAGLTGSTTYYSRVTTSLSPGLWGETRSFTTVAPGARTRSDSWRGDDHGDPIVEEPMTITTEENELIASPNPFTDRLEIRLQTEVQQPLAATMFDVAGKPVFRSTNWLTNRTEVVNGDFSPGIYLVTLQTDKGFTTLKVIRK